jgi:gamma-butyrobetaine dioxygenase
VKAYYHACKLFDRLLNDGSNVLWNKSKPGDILCFDNRRVLHGRSGFELVGGETRKLIGTYLRWDEIWSMARVKAATVFPDRLL